MVISLLASFLIVIHSRIVAETLADARIAGGHHRSDWFMMLTVVNLYHRLRELVRATQDPAIVAEFGVPRSTALGWLRDDYQPVVTDALFDKDIIELQAEIVKLRRRISILSAIIRLT